MKNSKLKHIFLPVLLLLVVLFSTGSCKKKEDISEEQRFGVDPALYGTWKTNDLNEVYYEFLKDSSTTCYWMRQSKIRSMDLMPFKLSQGSVKFGGITYPSYNVVSDTFLLLYDKNKKVIDTLYKKDNNLINYRNWLKSIKVLETYDVPQGYIPQSSAEFTNLGFEHDTLYYFHNFNRIVKFNPKSKFYFDSLNHFMINSFYFDGPILYYLSDGEVYKTDRYLNNPIKLGLKINYGRSMSLDQVSKTFYVMYGFTGNEMYAGKEGSTLSKLDKFQFLNAAPDATLFYKNNQFIELSNGKLYLSQYDGNTCSHVYSYALIPGYDYIGYISTNGNETWLTASKSASGKTKLFKVDLD